jgi:hypothetical protein
VGSVGTIQNFTVPVKGTYRIEVWGAQGGRVEIGNVGFVGGLGARMRGDFPLDIGTVLSVLVGQQGTSNSEGNSGGGGGSFVVRSDSNPLIIAGGGGGIREFARVNGGPGLITNTAGNCTLTPGGVPGSDGKGGGVLERYGAGGGGFSGNGADDYPWGFGGQAFLAGGNGGDVQGSNPCLGIGARSAPGGFGGGGAGNGGCTGGGGGGGYSGGPGCFGAGGGGSFNEGMDQSNSPGQRIGAGLVTITFIS